MCFVAIQTQMRFWLGHGLAVWSPTSSLTSQTLPYLVCKLRAAAIAESTLQVDHHTSAWCRIVGDSIMCKYFLCCVPLWIDGVIHRYLPI
jgi:hypothetical protein